MEPKTLEKMPTKFRDLGVGDNFKFPKGIDLREFGPQCPLHPGHMNKQCSFAKTIGGPRRRGVISGLVMNSGTQKGFVMMQPTISPPCGMMSSKSIKDSPRLCPQPLVISAGGFLFYFFQKLVLKTSHGINPRLFSP